MNEDLCSLISDYVHLEGNANPAYKLCSTAEIGENDEIPPAPSQPVFPPELIKGKLYLQYLHRHSDIHASIKRKDSKTLQSTGDSFLSTDA